MPGRSPFPKGYGQYLGADKLVKVEYLTTLAEQIARDLASERPQLTSHQLRAFFTHAKRAGDAWRRDLLPLESAVREIKKLESHAHARSGRGKISPIFYEFIRKNAQSVSADDEGKSLQAFLEHFEAVTGFCTGRLNDRE